MQEQEIAALNAWIVEAGLRGESEETLIRTFAERFVDAGYRLIGGRVLVDTLHPLYEGRAFRWRRGDAEIHITEYTSSSAGEALEKWRATPFYRLEETGERRRSAATSSSRKPASASLPQAE